MSSSKGAIDVETHLDYKLQSARATAMQFNAMRMIHFISFHRSPSGCLLAMNREGKRVIQTNMCNE